MKRKNIEFITIALGIFISGAILYGTMAMQRLEVKGVGFVVGASIRGGYFLSSLYCGGYIFSNFIRTKHLIFKVLCAVFFPITVLGIMSAGITLLIPTVLINIVALIYNGKKNDDVRIGENTKNIEDMPKM